MTLVIVPNSLRDAINAKLDAAIMACPEDWAFSEGERENLYNLLLRYFDEHGVVPDFTLQKATTS